MAWGICKLSTVGPHALGHTAAKYWQVVTADVTAKFLLLDARRHV